MAVAVALQAAVAVAAVLAGFARGGGLPVDCSLPKDTQTLLLDPLFTDRLAPVPMRLPRIETIDDLSSQLSDLFFPVDRFEDAYQGMVIAGHARGCLDTLRCNYEIFSVDYTIEGRRHTSYAYYKWAQERPSANAAVIIPGSGSNQSTAIYCGYPDNYQYDIAGIVGTHWDMYVCVKPNEDFLALNNGVGKLSYDYIVTHLANLGGSYSCRYIADTLAMVKYLRNSYDKVAVIGLSQGGQAALYNSLQSQPDGAIIASGYSVLQESMQAGSIGQMMIPGMRAYLDNEHIRDGLGASDTEYLFTWGRDESGIYGVEAWYRCTRSYFSGLSNVTCVSHGGGHIFPVETISVFLDNLRNASNGIAEDGALSQNAPNPFSSATRISFRVDTEGPVALMVFDAKGRLVKSLVDEVLEPDLYIEQWDGRDGDGRALPSGTYFYRLNTQAGKEVKKMTLAR